MRAFSTVSAAHRLLTLALLAVSTLGCQPNKDAQSGGPASAVAPAVPTPPPANAEAEPAPVEPTMVAAGEGRWIGLDELPWERWYLQYLDGNRVGYTQVLVQRSAIESDTQRVRITRTDCLEVDNNGATTRFKRTINSFELANGQMIELSDTSQSVDNIAKTEGRRMRGKFTATTSKSTAGEDPEKSQIAFDWDDAAWGVMGLQAVMMKHVPQPGEYLQADLFVPQLYKIAHAELLAGQPDLTALPNGQTQSLLTVDIALRSEDNGMLSRNWINERGEVLKTIALSGPNLSTFWTPAEVAHRTRDEFDLADLLGGHVPLVGELPTSETRQVVYQIDRDATASGEEVFTLLAKSATQSKTSLNALSAAATVTRAELESPETTDQPETALDECYLQASLLVPAKQASLISLAQQWATEDQTTEDQNAEDQTNEDQTNEDRADSDPQAVALLLTRRIHQEIDLAPLGRSVAGPMKTLQKKSGDCVAHTLLLTSLLRAQQIPARAVSGLRIDPDNPTQMLFYTWTEAWLAGRWLPLDSTTGGVAGPDRLKFSDSCLTSDNPYQIILPIVRQMPGLQVRIKSSE